MSVTAADPMAPSKAVVQYIKTLVRTTAWASSASDGRWRAAAVFLPHSQNIEKEGPENSVKAGQGVMISGKGQPPLPGEIRPVALKISVPTCGDLPGMFDHRLYLAGRDIQWKGKILDETKVPARGLITTLYSEILAPLRSDLLEKLKTVLPPLEASLASAVLLGAKDDSSRNSSKPFSDLGLAHLFAVSGLHVGVLLGLFLLPLKILGTSAWHKWVFLVLILPPYALLTGLPGSVVRAAGLAILATACHPMGRIGSPLHYLGILFWATTLWRPDQVLDIGVRLSYSAAAGILAFTSLSKGIDFPKKGVRGFLLGGLLISLAAQWATLPLAAAAFGRISLVSPLANLLAVPIFGIGVWLVVLALVGSIFPGGIAGIFSAWGWFIFRALAGFVNYSGHRNGGWNMGMAVPDPLMVGVWFGATALILVSLHMVNIGRFAGKRMIILMITVVFLVVGIFTASFKIPFQSSGPEVWQFDAGQGDCSVVRFPDGWAGLIDTAGRFGFSGENQEGPLSRKILPWLKRFDQKRFDAVLLTHGHLDHTGGASFLRTDYEVGKWYLAGTAQKSLLPDTTGLKMSRPVHGEILHQWENWSLKVYYPLNHMPQDLHENDYSLVVALQRNGQNQILWSGDLEKDGEALLLAGGGPGGKTRVWKAGHHGSNTSGSQPFLNIIDPELILISCGVGNGYSHPSHGFYVVTGDTVPVLRTDLQGSIHLKFHQNGNIFWESCLGRGQLPASP